MALGLQILLIYAIICFLKSSIQSTVKVVPNDTFKFGGKRVKQNVYGKNRTMSLQLTNSVGLLDVNGNVIQSRQIYCCALIHRVPSIALLTLDKLVPQL